MDGSEGCFEVVHPVQSEEADGKVVLFDVIELTLNILFDKLEFRLEGVVVFGNLLRRRSRPSAPPQLRSSRVFRRE